LTPNSFKSQNNLSRLGFKNERSGAHLARTIMHDELGSVLSYLNDPNAQKSDYLRAIDDENCLGKRSGKTRTLTFRHLVDLYSLDTSAVLFRALLYFWQRDPDCRTLVALLCAYSRDSILRSATPLILVSHEGTTITRESVEACIDEREPGRFSPATLKSTAQNINSSFTQAGLLTGKVRKVRTRANPTSGAVSYALLLGYLTGARGESLFQTEYVKLLDCSFERALSLAEDASRRGWIVFKRVGDVIEVVFPNLITAEEMEWVREQS
jgi:hypothetical protein